LELILIFILSAASYGLGNAKTAKGWNLHQIKNDGKDGRSDKRAATIQAGKGSIKISPTAKVEAIKRGRLRKRRASRSRAFSAILAWRLDEDESYFAGRCLPKAATASLFFMRAFGLPRSSRFCSSVPSPSYRDD
jgi:hypothetical protein